MAMKSSGTRNKILPLWDTDLRLTSGRNATICLPGMLIIDADITQNALLLHLSPPESGTRRANIFYLACNLGAQ